MSADSRRPSTRDASGPDTRHLSVVRTDADTDTDADTVSVLAPSASRDGHVTDTWFGRRWVSVPQVCAELQVSPTEWESWRQQGQTPLHLVTSDGTTLIRRADLDAWVRGLPDDVPPAT